MTPAPDFGNLDVTEFSVGAMLRAGVAVRRAVKGSATVEDAASVVVRYLYDHCVDPASGERTCVLARFYKTHAFHELPADLRGFALAQLGDTAASDEMRCLALLGTVGAEPSWNARQSSRSHKAIPLPSVDIVRQAPMIARLIEDIGLDIASIVEGNATRSSDRGARTYDVFHIEDARGSPHIPAQEEFVVRYGVRSVVGFGGLLRSGELFAVILFTRVHVPAASAARFRAIALDVRSALFALDESRTWKNS